MSIFHFRGCLFGGSKRTFSSWNLSWKQGRQSLTQRFWSTSKRVDRQRESVFPLFDFRRNYRPIMPRSFLVKKVKLDDFSAAELESSYGQSRREELSLRFHHHDKG